MNLVVERTLRATPERIFEVWTKPEHLTKWFGPAGATCPEASVDLRVGGAYRIANRFPDGTVVWISGVFEVVQPPSRLVYTWQTNPKEPKVERVTVELLPSGGGTRVVITHELIPSEQVRAQHQAGWEGCLDGLTRYAEP